MFLFLFLFLNFFQLIAQDFSFNNNFYFLKRRDDIFSSDCFSLGSKDFVLFHKLHDNEILKGLPFLKKTNILEKMFTERATKHFRFFHNFFPKNFYQKLFHYFSSDTKDWVLNDNNLLVWQCFFDYEKENDFLLETFVFDEKSRNEKKNFYDKRLRSMLLGEEFLEVWKYGNIKARGNCNGLALYSFLNCLYRQKEFNYSHIITLGSIKENGDIGKVGGSFNKFIYWLVYLQYKVLTDKYLDQNDFLFLISGEYTSFIFEKMFLFFEEKFNTKINRFYIKNIKDLESSHFYLNVNNDRKKENFINGKTKKRLFFYEENMKDWLNVLDLKLFDMYDLLACSFETAFKEKGKVFNFLKSYPGPEEFFDFIFSLLENRFLSLEEKKDIMKHFSRKEVENVCSFFSSGTDCIKFFYEDK